MNKTKTKVDTEIKSMNENPDLEDNGVVRVRSKAVYEFLAGFLNITGADRLYCGAYMSGFLKLGLFIGLFICIGVAASSGFVTSNFSDAINVAGWSVVMLFIIVIILSIWVIVDYVIAIINGLSKSKIGPWSMGANKIRWTNDEDIQTGFYVTLFFLFFNLFLTPVIAAAF